MAEAVENAEVMLMCISERYKESPNCRTGTIFKQQIIHMGIQFFPGSCSEGVERSTSFRQSQPDNNHVQNNPKDPSIFKNISVPFHGLWFFINFSWSLLPEGQPRGIFFYWVEASTMSTFVNTCDMEGLIIIININHKGNWLGRFLGLNKELTRVGFEPTTSGLTCRRSTNWAI